MHFSWGPRRRRRETNFPKCSVCLSLSLSENRDVYCRSKHASFPGRQTPGNENVVGEGADTDPCCTPLFEDCTHSSIAETQVGGGCFQAAKESGTMSQQLPDVAPMEDPGGGGGMPVHSIMAAVMELQSLVEWTAQRRGVKEDASVVNEKLRQLDKIRKELERSARLQTAVSPSSTETSLIQNITDDNEKPERDFISSSPPVKSAQDSSDKITVPLICDQDTAFHLPMKGLTKDIHTYSECAMEDGFHLEDIPPPIDENSCDNALGENNVDLYINFVSAKEGIEKLTMDLEIEGEEKSLEKVDPRHHATDEPDSLGTAISEDEGLGEESRRADSTGSNSFLDIHTSEEDLVDSGAGASSVHYAEEVEPSSKTDVVWINDPQDPRLSIELCRCTIYKLKECLKAKEEQLKKIRDEYQDNNQVKALQTLVNNLKNEMEELKSQLKASQKEKCALREQVLELEEAENDSRRQCQRYEEKVLFLQEKDVHFQAELVDTKQTLEMCMSTLSAKDAEEKELRSQLKYTEVLVQKYEDQIKTLETSESKLKQKTVELEEQLLKFRNSKSDVSHKGTQTYAERAMAEIESRDSSKASSDCCEKQCVTVRHKIRHSKFKSLSESDASQFCETGVQINLVSSTKENATQTDYDVQMCCESRSTIGEVQTPSDNSSVALAVELSCESTPSTEPETTLSSSCPFQQELFRRLHHLVEEDAHLQQQLHHMDQINLTLWQKLHNLEFHIGECKKENFQHHARMDDEARVSETTSSVNIPLRDQSSVHLLTDKTLSLDAGEEEHFVSSGRMINLDFNEEGLKDRLLRLEQINSTFEAELRNREKLYQMKEQKHKEWMEAEDRFTCDIRYLQMEKNSLLAKVTQLEAEKQRFTNKLLAMVDELACLQERHKRQISLMMEEHEALVSELRSRIELLTKKEKEYVGQISSLRMEKKARKEMVGERSELESLKASYVQLQIELSQNRSNMIKMENEFEEHLEALRRSHLSEEARLEEEVQRLREKESDFNEQLSAYQKRQSELEAALCDKEQQLEDARLEFKEQLLAMEEEHRTVETELNRKLRQMEESTAVATKALTEEKVRLEKELQENLYDLRTKEEQYKSRIAELEANVSQLHVELRRLTGDLDAGFPGCDGTEFPPFQKERLQKQLQELQRREGDLREKLEEMEQKEAAYRETLENADRIVASVERGYKNKIEELEMSERSLKQRVNHLEEIESKLRVALHRERRSSDGRKPDDLVLELLEAEVRENTLKDRIETLEQTQRSTSHRLKELEKIRESLESKMVDHNELVTSLDRLQQEHDISRKENAKLRISESGLKLALQQAEGMLKNRETEVRNEMQRMQEEKKDLEETIHQLRMQVRQLQLLVDCTQEEDTSGETLSESVHGPEISDSVAISKESEILESTQPLKTSSPKGEGHSATDVVTAVERVENVIFQKDCETSEDLLGNQFDGLNKDVFPVESDKDTSGTNCSENVLKFDVRSDSAEVRDQSEGASSPTVEFFLPEPKKLQYEVLETSIPEPKSLQEMTNPLASTEKGLTDTNANEIVEIAADEASTPKPSEQLHYAGLVTENVPDEAAETEASDQAAVASLQSESSTLHSEMKETTALTEETRTDADQVSERSKALSASESDESHKPITDDTVDDPSVAMGDDLESLFVTSAESVSNDLKTSGTTNAVFLADELSSQSDVLNSKETSNTQEYITNNEPREDKETDISKQTCDIHLLHEEMSVYGAGEISSEGNIIMPADSILKLLRGLRPGTTALGPCAQLGARPKTIVRQRSFPDDIGYDLISQGGEKGALRAEDRVDWLKVAEESAFRYAEEKKVLEGEVKRLREKATSIEKEKEILQESLKKVEDVESLREMNEKLQEEVSLLQKRLKMDVRSDSAEAKAEKPKCLSQELILKKGEVKTENKSDQTPKKETSVPCASSCRTTPLGTSPPPLPGPAATSTSGVARPLTTSPPPPPPIDECRKERMQLEENMIRAMVAMQFDMKQKKAAKRFNPAYGGSDSSARSTVADEKVVAMAACGSGAEEDRNRSSSSKRPNVHSPFNFRVVQQVGSDTVLVGWEHAHPIELEGFEVYVNGTLQETVYTPDRTKAVISGLDLQQDLTLSVCAISRSGDVSEPQLLRLPQRDRSSSSSRDGFFFLDEDDDDYDDIFYVDEETERRSDSRPYSMEW